MRTGYVQLVPAPVRPIPRQVPPAAQLLPSSASATRRKHQVVRGVAAERGELLDAAGSDRKLYSGWSHQYTDSMSGAWRRLS